MKKLIITTVLALFVATSALANDIRINSVAKSNFKRDFQNVETVQWQTMGNHSFAIFNLNGEMVKAYYNEDGELYGTSRKVDAGALPVAVKRHFSKKYGSYTLTEAVRFDGLYETAYFLTADTGKDTVILKLVNGSVTEYIKVKK